jgi:hypothetical protein
VIFLQRLDLYLKSAGQPYNHRTPGFRRRETEMDAIDETFPDLGSMSDGELKELIDELADEEREVSFRRRLLHGRIDILRAELVNRLKAKREEGESALTGADVRELTDILAGKVADPGEGG